MNIYAYIYIYTCMYIYEYSRWLHICAPYMYRQGVKSRVQQDLLYKSVHLHVVCVYKSYEYVWRRVHRDLLEA